jgi:hypothetical protein
MALLLRNAVFIHIPKTAGQWVAHAIRRAGLAEGSLGPVHASPDELAHDPRYRSRPIRFAFVRDPVTWYPSMWAHRTHEAWSPIDDPEWFSERWIDRWAEFTANVRAKTFDEFVNRCAEWYPDGWVSRLYEAYTDDCTHIGRSETVQDDLVRILRLAGDSVDPVNISKTPAMNVRASVGGRNPLKVYSPDSLDLVTRVEKRARVRYGYVAAIPATGVTSRATPLPTVADSQGAPSHARVEDRERARR